MIEVIVLNHLDDKLNVPCTFEQTYDAEKYVLIERTGGGKKNKASSATLAIQSYAKSMYEAIQLNEEVKEAMFELVSLDEIGSIELNSDYNFTDLSTKKYRYQAVFNITYI